MKPVFYFAIATCLYVLASCTSAPYSLVKSRNQESPLDSNAIVRVVYASDIPVIPQNSTYLGIAETDGSGNCPEGHPEKVLIDAARSVGANFVFIKGFTIPNEIPTMSRFFVPPCIIATADFYRVDFGGAK
jgi:hypothetical protein